MCGAGIPSSRTKCLVLVSWVESASAFRVCWGLGLTLPPVPGSYAYGYAHE